MRRGTLGNGLLVEALAGRWVEAGHEVMVGGRDPERVAELAKRIGAVAGSLTEAAAYGEVVLLAVPAEVAVEVAKLVLPGRTLIDCTNALDHTDFTLAHPATAEAISRAVPEVQVVKAFNLAADTVWRNPPAGLGVPICGDGGLDLVAKLVRSVGCVPRHRWRVGTGEVAGGNCCVGDRDLGGRGRRPRHVPGASRRVRDGSARPVLGSRPGRADTSRPS